MVMKIQYLSIHTVPYDNGHHNGVKLKYFNMRVGNI